MRELQDKYIRNLLRHLLSKMIENIEEDGKTS